MITWGQPVCIILPLLQQCWWKLYCTWNPFFHSLVIPTLVKNASARYKDRIKFVWYRPSLPEMVTSLLITYVLWCFVAGKTPYHIAVKMHEFECLNYEWVRYRVADFVGNWWYVFSYMFDRFTNFWKKMCQDRINRVQHHFSNLSHI